MVSLQRAAKEVGQPTWRGRAMWLPSTVAQKLSGDRGQPPRVIHMRSELLMRAVCTAEL